MEDNVSTGEESENLLIIVLQAFEYHKLERFLRKRVSGKQKNVRVLNTELLFSIHHYYLGRSESTDSTRRPCFMVNLIDLADFAHLAYYVTTTFNPRVDGVDALSEAWLPGLNQLFIWVDIQSGFPFSQSDT